MDEITFKILAKIYKDPNKESTYDGWEYFIIEDADFASISRNEMRNKFSIFRNEYLEYATFNIGNDALLKLNGRGINAYNVESVKYERKEEKDNLELQKLRSENLKLVNDLADYKTIKKQRNVLFGVSIISLALLILKFVLDKS